VATRRNGLFSVCISNLTDFASAVGGLAVTATMSVLPDTSGGALAAIASAVAHLTDKTQFVRLAADATHEVSGSYPVAVAGVVTMSTLPDTATGLIAAIKGKTDNLPAQGSALMAGSLPVTLAADGAMVTRSTIACPGIKATTSLAAAAEQAAVSMAADGTLYKVGTVTGGQAYWLQCTEDAAAQDGTYACVFQAVVAAAAAPAYNTAWARVYAGAPVYLCYPTGSFDIYAGRASAGKTAMSCQLIALQPTA
jgi:hypothetical protein